MARAYFCILGGCVCGIGAALAMSYALLTFAPDLPEGVL